MRLADIFPQAHIMQCGWYKEVRVKDLDSHAIRALLGSRALLVELKRDLENQIRGLLKNLGLVIGRAKLNTFTTRAKELIDGQPALAAAVEPLLKAREALARQMSLIGRFDSAWAAKFGASKLSGEPPSPNNLQPKELEPVGRVCL